MLWKKILFIYNPVAGRTQIREYLPDIIDTLSAADFKVLCYPTRGQGDARRIVRERQEDYLYVVCAGGDGTLDEVVSGMMENPDKPFVPIGYIPAGTTNDFATSLHIPTDMRQAAQIIAQGRTFRCDLGLFNETDYFTYVAAFGIFTGTSYQTPQELKNQIGHLAYIFQGVSELGNMRAYNMHVEAEGLEEPAQEKHSAAAMAHPETGEYPAAEGQVLSFAGAGEKEKGPHAESRETGRSSVPADRRKRVIDGEFALGMITNSRSIGGFANITGSRVDLQDGRFEVTLVRMPKNPLELSEILFSIGNPQASTSMIYNFKAARVTLECDEQVAWTRDGEYAGAHRRVSLENHSRQLRILVPEEHADSF